MKVCKKCNFEKAASDFYGKQTECKECTKARVKKYRLENIEKVREYDRNRPNAKERNERFKKAHKEKMKDPAYRERVQKIKREWSEKNMIKRSAQWLVGNAIRDGYLIRQPCEICGESTVDAHHDDYEKPLDVRWLCRKHHAEHHKQEREEQRKQ